MDKEKDENQATVIQFPKLRERLIEKGLSTLKEKNFKQALSLLLQAEELNEDHDEIELGIVICLLELGQLDEAKSRCKAMLQQDIGDYFNVLQVYLTILIQLGEYDDVRNTIEMVLEENQIPAQYLESFYNLLELSKKMIDTQVEEPEHFHEEIDLEVQLHNVLIENSNSSEQIGLIQSLKERNIHKYIEIFKLFLQDETKHPIVKSLILQLLMENKVSEDVTVTKLGKSITRAPDQLEDLGDSNYSKSVLNLLDDKLGNENPTLYEVTKDLWLRYLFVLYPFTPTESPEIWAAGLHLYGYELHGIEIGNTELENTYNINLFQLKGIIDQIQQIEEISLL